VRLEGLGKLKKIHLIGSRTGDLPVCSIVIQPLGYRMCQIMLCHIIQCHDMHPFLRPDAGQPCLCYFRRALEALGSEVCTAHDGTSDERLHGKGKAGC
jgi:hypothetical protein